MPLLAAGGIADGRTLAAALTAGADGAWLGTAFLATPEAVEVHAVHKDLIVASDGGDTVFDLAYDIVSGLPWPAGIGTRLRRNRFTDEWAGREAELRGPPGGVRRPAGRNPFDKPPDPDTDARPLRPVRRLRRTPSARPPTSLRTICADAEAILRSRPGQLLG